MYMQLIADSQCLRVPLFDEYNIFEFHLIMSLEIAIIDSN